MSYPSEIVRCNPNGKAVYTVERYMFEHELPAGCEIIVRELALRGNCSRCGRTFVAHAHCDALKLRRLVCPGNVIVTYPDGSKVQFTPELFHAAFNIQMAAHPWPAN